MHWILNHQLVFIGLVCFGRLGSDVDEVLDGVVGGGVGLGDHVPPLVRVRGVGL